MKAITVENFSYLNVKQWVSDWSHEEKVQFAVNCAELVIHLYTGSNDAPKKAIQTAKNWLLNPSDANKKKCRDAAYAADAAAYTAADAADTAADAAAYAAADAAADAAAAAAYAAYAAAAATDADAAAGAAAAADAAYAADAAAYAAAAYADAAYVAGVKEKIIGFIKGRNAMSIDWSKAPEGAEYAGWSLDELFWYRDVKANSYEVYLAAGKWQERIGPPKCQRLIPRPTTDTLRSDLAYLLSYETHDTDEALVAEVEALQDRYTELRHQLRSALNIETRDPSDAELIAAVEALASDMAKISKAVHEPQNGMQWCGNEVDTVVELINSRGSEWQNGDECIWEHSSETGFKFVALHPENKEVAVVWAGGNDYRHCLLDDLEPRVVSNEWDGEGLPPVGAVAMTSVGPGECTGYVYQRGYRKAVIQFAHDYGVFGEDAVCKPETPEQRERAEAIQAMHKIGQYEHCSHEDVRKVCENLYDAGYHK